MTSGLERSDKENELAKSVGTILIVTGFSGAGKDTVMNALLQHPDFGELDFKQVVTHATRGPRADEVDGVHYHFIQEEVLKEMYANGELVEPLTPTGETFKATSKKALMEVLNGVNLIWRIELSRAGEVASGDFFKEMFEEEVAKILNQNTLVIVIEADREELEHRRRDRDKDAYDAEDYAERDRQEHALLARFGEHLTTRVTNRHGKLDETVEEVIALIQQSVKAN